MTKHIFAMGLWLAFSTHLLGSIVSNTANANQVSEFSESYSDTVKVSGQFLKGLQFTDVNFEITPHIYFPRAYLGSVCVFVSSADGRYKSQYQYTFTEHVEGVVPIEFPTKYTAELKDFSAGELGLLTSAQPNCAQLNGDYLISAWGKPNSLNAISIFVRSNARRDIATPLLKSDKQPGAAVKCQDLRSNYRVSYDKECLITDVMAEELQRVIIKRRNLRAIPDELIEFY
ncbi:hypothetical protein [Pseudidiomarina sp.]|uniref:hypothetical protein n=1 Tax=Pseudidiomarina sp. TaxID=2081707 RepID=UPI003A978D22